MKQSTKIEPTPDQLKFRMLQAKSKLGEDFKLRGVYEYFYGKLEENDFYILQNCWLTKSSSEEITKRIEALADNKNNLPLNP